ncbi:unnamed protein product, partial [Ixodes persulcatus]
MRQAPATPVYHCGQPKPVRKASRATANTRCPRAVRAAEFARGTHASPKAITSGSGRGSSCLARSSVGIRYRGAGGIRARRHRSRAEARTGSFPVSSRRCYAGTDECGPPSQHISAGLPPCVCVLQS